MRRHIVRILVAVLLLCGVVCSSVLLAGRISAERDDRHAAAVVFYSDVVELSEQSGLHEEEWLKMFAENGVRYVVFRAWPNRVTLDLLEELSMAPACAGTESGEWAFVIPDGEVPDWSNNVPLVLVENAYRTSVHLPNDFDLNGYDGALVKALYMYEGYSNGYSEENGAQRMEDTMFRGVVERGLRLILLRPFTDANHTMVLDPMVYADTLSDLGERIQARGLTFGDCFTCMETKPLRPGLLWGSGLLTVGLWLFLLTRPEPMRRWVFALGAVAVVALGLGCLLMPLLAQKMLMLLCALAFSCVGVYAIWRVLRSNVQGTIPAVAAYLISLCVLVVWSGLGGLAVSALMSDRCYLMGYIIFSGVKVSQGLPLALCAVSFGYLVVKRLRQQPLTLRGILPVIVVAVLGAAALGIMMLRSGDVGRISKLETFVRNMLEYYLYVRPRTKEFLVAVPVAALAFTVPGRKYPIITLVGAMGYCLELVSVINTFCHAVTPIHSSVIRTLLGAGIGAIIGVVVIGVCALLFPKRKHPMESQSASE